MRKYFDQQLEGLHTSLIQMSALCEAAIASASKALLKDDEKLREKAIALEQDIRIMARELEQTCLRLLLREQPVAGDLRSITAAQKMIYDLERIGDQAADIAELALFMKGSTVKSDTNISDMARATVKMLTDGIDSFVHQDLDRAKAVIAYDDTVDALFLKIKQELIDQLIADSSLAGSCLDLLMIAKYLERIGDHTENIAGWVLFAITGSRDAVVMEDNQ